MTSKKIGDVVIAIIEGGTMRTGNARIFEALLDERIDERVRKFAAEHPIVAQTQVRGGTREMLEQSLAALTAKSGNELIRGGLGATAADAIEARVDIIARSLLGRFVGDFEKMVDERIRAAVTLRDATPAEQEEIMRTVDRNMRDVLKPGEELSGSFQGPIGPSTDHTPMPMPVAPSKLLIALDFDRVVHKATSKWTTAHDVNDDPVDGAFDFIRRALDSKFGVVLHTARARTDSTIPRIYSWLRAHGLEEKYCWQVEITALKPAAHVYIDDAAWRFTGVWPTLDEIRNLRPWNDSTVRHVNAGNYPDGRTISVCGVDLKVGEGVDGWGGANCVECLKAKPNVVMINDDVPARPAYPKTSACRIPRCDGVASRDGEVWRCDKCGSTWSASSTKAPAVSGVEVDPNNIDVVYGVWASVKPEASGDNDEIKDQWVRRNHEQAEGNRAMARMLAAYLNAEVPHGWTYEAKPLGAQWRELQRVSERTSSREPNLGAAPRTETPSGRAGWICSKRCGWADVSSHFERHEGDPCPNCKASIEFLTHIQPETLHHVTGGPTARIPDCARGNGLVDTIKGGTGVTEDWKLVTCEACLRLRLSPHRSDELAPLHHVSDAMRPVPDCIRAAGAVPEGEYNCTTNWLQVTCPNCKTLQPRPRVHAGAYRIEKTDTVNGCVVTIHNALEEPIDVCPFPDDGRPRRVTAVMCKTDLMAEVEFLRDDKIIAGMGGGGEFALRGGFDVTSDAPVTMRVRAPGSNTTIRIHHEYASVAFGQEAPTGGTGRNPWERRCDQIAEILERKSGESHLEAAERVVSERNRLINECARLRQRSDT